MVETKNREWLITGGSGSLGKALTKVLLKEQQPRGIRIFSRGEIAQWAMEHSGEFDGPVSYLIGDVRDKDRLRRAMEGVDFVVHAAAIKRIDAAEKDPMEAIKTNVNGAMNVIDAALDARVERVMNISTDKAVYSINLYGHTKAVAEKLFVHANVYRSGSQGVINDPWLSQRVKEGFTSVTKKNITRFSCCRYGNVLGSRGSVVPLFKQQAEQGILTLTDLRMTRFWITLPQVARFIIARLQDMEGGEIFIPKMPSMKISDMATCIVPDHETEFKLTGVRQGEKLHETLITWEEGERVFISSQDDSYYIIHEAGQFPTGTAFVWTSENNTEWLTPETLKEMLEED